MEKLILQLKLKQMESFQNVSQKKENVELTKSCKRFYDRECIDRFMIFLLYFNKKVDIYIFIK